MDVDADGTDREFHYKKNPRKIYISGSFPANPNVPKLRYVSQVTDQEGGLAFATVDGVLVLSRTPTGRFEIRATVVEDDRSIRSVLIQRWDTAKGPSKHDHFTLGEAAVGRLIHFFDTIKTMPLEGDGKIHLTTDEIKDIALDLTQAERLFVDNEDLFLNVAQNSEELKGDLLALGYRRKTLRTFERMMTDEAFFESEKERLKKTDETVWQAFFEANTWIFGYGLSYQFLGKIDEGKMERYVIGHDIAGAGKEADGVLKTQARINSLCFVEIKHHKTTLITPTVYRSETWMPGKHVVGGVAQIQTTVQSAIERYSPKMELTNADGEPIGDPLFAIDPKAFLVVGSLDQFITEDGKINAKKLRAFELYRRNMRRPEILTFDELFHRARAIVGDGATPTTATDLPVKPG